MENNKNVLERLQDVRVELQKLNIKKDATNNFTKFNYYTLNSILPPINDLCQKHRLTYVTTFTKEEAKLTFYNQDNVSDIIEFTVPFIMSDLKSAPRIQCLGGSLTYLTRYLLISALGIAESDFYDSLSNDDLQEKEQVKQEDEQKEKLIKEIIKNKENKELQLAIKNELKETNAKSIKELPLESLVKICKEVIK